MRSLGYALAIADKASQTTIDGARSLKADGHVIVVTCGPDGPLQCSGLPIRLYDPDSMHDEFGDRFDLVGHSIEEHWTPFSTIQEFV